MIDRRYQNKGYGTQALRRIGSMLRSERKYGRICVCVHQTDGPALRPFQKAGLEDTGYVDEQAPDCRNLVYRFTDSDA